MRVIAETDIVEFTDTVMPFLGRDPVGSNIIATILAARSRRDTGEQILLWRVVGDGDDTAGVALLTPPMPMIVTGMADEALQALASAAKAQRVHRFNGPGARRLAELVASDGAEVRRIRGSGVFRLETVVPPRPAEGAARLARPDDLDAVTHLVQGFREDLGDPEQMPPEVLRRRIDAGEIWLWEAGGRPATLTARTPAVNGMARINLVYTPQCLRGRGYASNLVAVVAQAILDEGHTPMLYTDLARPTPNKVYQQIGFGKVAEHENWAAVHPVPQAGAAAANRLTHRWAQALGPDAATVFSGASVWPLLAMLAGAATGSAAEELRAVAGVADPAGEAERFLTALPDIAHVHAALGLWTRPALPLQSGWAERALPLHDQKTLDSWVRRETAGLLDRLPIQIDEDTLLVLANALTVRTKWSDPFEQFRQELWRTTNDFDAVTVAATPAGPVTRLCVTGTGEVDVFLLTDLVHGIGSLIDDVPVVTGSQILAGDAAPGPALSLTETRGWSSTPDLLTRTHKFTIGAGHDLLERPVLFGLSAATDHSRGHFPGISTDPLAISAARQNAVATFDATGFEAAAVTAFGAVAGGMPSAVKKQLCVTFTPPFGFAAVHRASGLILIAGRVTGSDQSG